MKYIRYCLFLLLLLTIASCKDEVNLNSFKQESKLVVYCFPSPGDTTYLRVTRSIPVRYYADTVRIAHVDDASVVYTVNGTPCTATPVGQGYYRIVGQQRVGDNISLRVSAPNAQEVLATTTIPDTVAVTNIRVKPIEIKTDDSTEPESFMQVMATFTDDASTHRYYAVRVKCTTSATNSINEADFIYPNIHTESEPLLSPLTDIDDQFGFSNSFYDDFNIFDDTSINGQTYTLRLNIRPFVGPSWLNVFYQVELISITPEFYHFMTAINQYNNNELAQNGLSQIRPTVTNISGGLGLLGAWSTSHTQWAR